MSSFVLWNCNQLIISLNAVSEEWEFFQLKKGPVGPQALGP